MTLLICGNSADFDSYVGLPPPTEPHCDVGHSRILMRWRVRKDGYWCRHCGRVMTWEENIAAPHNEWYRRRDERLQNYIKTEMKDERGIG